MTSGLIIAIRNGVDCPVAYRLSLLNGDPVPLFIKYNSVTHQAELNPLNTADVGTYVVVLTAIMESDEDFV